MIRISELKLPLTALPSALLMGQRRAAAAPAETEADRAPLAHPLEALQQLAAHTLHINAAQIHDLQVFKRSFDARKADIVAVYIVDLRVPQALEDTLLAQFAAH
ncbi:MAG: FAD-dependent oxidoreductase, partial [Rhodoferax sp.]|nr:FAD-dependent oxidoreductase [Rhodoferax sp.]